MPLNLGLVGAGGAGGAVDALQEILKRRFLEDQQRQRAEDDARQRQISQQLADQQGVYQSGIIEHDRAALEQTASEAAAKRSDTSAARQRLEQWGARQTGPMKLYADALLNNVPGVNPGDFTESQSLQSNDDLLYDNQKIGAITFNSKTGEYKSGQRVLDPSKVTKEHYVDPQVDLQRKLRIEAMQRADAPVAPESVDWWAKQLINDPTMWNMLAGNKPLQNAVQAALPSYGTDLNKLTLQSRQMSEIAKEILPHLKTVLGQASKIEELGLFGPGGGRFRDFMVDTIGAGELAGGSAENAKLLGSFHANQGLLATAAARAHGGARGGSSPTMVEHLQSIIDAAGKDFPTFQGQLMAVTDWMQTYANLVPTDIVKGGKGGEPPPPAIVWKDGQLVLETPGGDAAEPAAAPPPPSAARPGLTLPATPPPSTLRAVTPGAPPPAAAPPASVRTPNLFAPPTTPGAPPPSPLRAGPPPPAAAPPPGGAPAPAAAPADHSVSFADLQAVAKMRGTSVAQEKSRAITENFTVTGDSVSIADLQQVAKMKGTTVDQEKARARAEGYTIEGEPAFQVPDEFRGAAFNMARPGYGRSPAPGAPPPGGMPPPPPPSGAAPPPGLSLRGVGGPPTTAGATSLPALPMRYASTADELTAMFPAGAPRVGEPPFRVPTPASTTLRTMSPSPAPPTSSVRTPTTFLAPGTAPAMAPPAAPPAMTSPSRAGAMRTPVPDLLHEAIVRGLTRPAAAPGVAPMGSHAPAAPAAEFKSKLDLVTKAVEAETGLSMKVMPRDLSAAAQAKRFAQGRTEPGAIVTDADGTNVLSKHQSDEAADMLFVDKNGRVVPLTDAKGRLTKEGERLYAIYGRIAEAHGLVWGGRWKTPYDPRHIQLGAELARPQRQ